MQCLRKIPNAKQFQFHKGAIGVALSRLKLPLMQLFQFHKGAIGVKDNRGNVMRNIEFQFHKGAIGVRRTWDMRNSYCNFNSIKVRLEFRNKYKDT